MRVNPPSWFNSGNHRLSVSIEQHSILSTKILESLCTESSTSSSPIHTFWGGDLSKRYSVNSGSFSALKNWGNGKVISLPSSSLHLPKIRVFNFSYDAIIASAFQTICKERDCKSSLSPPSIESDLPYLMLKSIQARVSLERPIDSTAQNSWFHIIQIQDFERKNKVEKKWYQHQAPLLIIHEHINIGFTYLPTTTTHPPEIKFLTPLDMLFYSSSKTFSTFGSSQKNQSSELEFFCPETNSDGRITASQIISSLKLTPHSMQTHRLRTNNSIQKQFAVIQPTPMKIFPQGNTSNPQLQCVAGIALRSSQFDFVSTTPVAPTQNPDLDARLHFVDSKKPSVKPPTLCETHDIDTNQNQSRPIPMRPISLCVPHYIKQSNDVILNTLESWLSQHPTMQDSIGDVLVSGLKDGSIKTNIQCHDQTQTQNTLPNFTWELMENQNSKQSISAAETNRIVILGSKYYTETKTEAESIGVFIAAFTDIVTDTMNDLLLGATMQIIELRLVK